ncbi:FimV/HubP family polar landmark protein [Vibrio neonatus]|uniref:FimV/HubP family polar landmark protein n=1 Tax=Vibrio neonatus TaxID=278860 RepID=UPI0036F1A74C
MELYRRTLIVIACLCVSIVAHAEDIRLVGPSGHLQAVPTYIVPDSLDGTKLNRDQNKLSSQRTYGPTAIDETLWSIGQTVRTSEQQSVYKVILAIYKNNLADFEDRNIHLLKPGSIITLPTDAEIDKQSVAEAVRLLKIHAKKPSYLAKIAQDNAPTKINVEDLGARQIQQKQIEFLQQQLQSSQQEFSSLRQNNQDLLQALGSIRTDVVQLKGQLDLETQRRAAAEQTLKAENANLPAPAPNSSLLTNVWVIVALSAAVTALIMLLIIKMTLSVRPVPQIGKEPTEPKALNPVPSVKGDNDPEIENVEPIATVVASSEENTEAQDVQEQGDDGQASDAAIEMPARAQMAQSTVNPLDKEFEQELDKILAVKVTGETATPDNTDSDGDSDESTEQESHLDEIVNVADLPEYGEREALADAKKEALALLAEDDLDLGDAVAESNSTLEKPVVATGNDDAISESAELAQEDPESTTPYKSIDEVIAEADAEPVTNPDDEELDLRVGLEEFPDVIGNVELKDVDVEGELSSQIDLASVYIQMNDLNHAGKLLRDVIDKGNEHQQQRAQKLLDSIHS